MTIPGHKILFLLCVAIYCSCTDTAKQPVVTAPLPIDFKLLNQIVFDTTLADGSIFHEWQADVLISNNTTDTIWVFKGMYNELICKFKIYLNYDKTIKEMRYSEDLPMADYASILPGNSKKFMLALPLGTNWSCPDESYIMVTPEFLPSLSNILKYTRSVLDDTLQKNVCYAPNYNYHIDKNCKRIRLIQENVDSIFKNTKVQSFY